MSAESPVEGEGLRRSQTAATAIFSQLPSHDHRKLRGDRGYHYRDIKGEALG